MLTTAEAAALLIERGVTVRSNPPTARTVEVWCRTGALPARRIGGPRRGIYLIDPAALDAFQPPTMGRRPAHTPRAGQGEDDDTKVPGRHNSLSHKSA
jgi:hypothetical protein